MPAGMPAAGSASYKFTLANFIGEDQQGGWSLWVVSRLQTSFQIAGGFEVTIT
jgi:hypothetical protein